MIVEKNWEDWILIESKQISSWFYLIMQYRIHHLMNYKKFRCVLRLSDKDWRIWRLWLTISCLHSSTCESWSPPIYCWRSSSKHCQSSKHSGRVCHTLSAQSSLSIFVNAKILILSYEISIFAFTKIVLEWRYLEMIAS